MIWFPSTNPSLKGKSLFLLSPTFVSRSRNLSTSSLWVFRRRSNSMLPNSKGSLRSTTSTICDPGVLEHVFAHSPPIKLDKKNEIERQLLANLFLKKSRRHPKSQHVHNPPIQAPTETTKVVGMEQPRSVKQSSRMNGADFLPNVKKTRFGTIGNLSASLMSR